MKRSTKIITIVLVFFLVITSVIIARTMIGNHFKKKFSKRPPPGIIVFKVSEKYFSEKIESFGTAIPKKTESFRIQKNNLASELKLQNYVDKGSVIVKLKDKNILAPFSGILGYRGLTEDVLGSDNSIIITLDDSTIIYADLKIPEAFASVIKKCDSEENFQYIHEETQGLPGARPAGAGALRRGRLRRRGFLCWCGPQAGFIT